MPSDLARSVFLEIARQGMVRPGDRLGVGVSGGADSVALLRLFEELQSELGIRLTVLHFNHQLRGEESDADERFVAALAAERGLFYLAGREDVRRAAREQGWNLEDAARRLRYGYFSSVLETGEITRVAVAHTADDQAETVLARLVRGTGPAGLAAIYPIAKIGSGRAAMGTLVVRPLLHLRRSELREHLQQLGQPWREDSSNSDLHRLRARLRHQILPLIERDVQPAIVKQLGRLAEMAREDEAFWTALIDARLNAVAHRESDATATDAKIAVRCADLLAPFPLGLSELSGDAQLAVARRLVRRCVEELRGDCRELTSGHVAQVLRLAKSGISGQSSHLPGIVVQRSFEWLHFYPAARADSESTGDIVATDRNFHYSIELESLEDGVEVRVPQIRRLFRLKMIDWANFKGETGEDTCTLDRDLLQLPLVIRNWRAGDSYKPLGSRGVHKLKHLLRARRVDRCERAGWPVLVSGGELAWVRGLPVAAKFAPRERTRVGLVVAEEEC